ncbi:MAG: inorganic phosphate transporter [Anaerolineales bacterium]|nr:inorganic phosphate transporter [Anaerolineales bacterium]
MFPYLLGLALAFDFLNGFHDSSNIVATVISSRALPPRLALFIAATAEFSGPFIFGVAVAKTVGDDLLNTETLTVEVILAALIASVIWNLITWRLGIPSSSSHALVGGLLGAGIIANGLAVVQIPGLTKILIALLISPLLGLLMGFMVMNLTMLLARKASPKISTLFKRLQLGTLIGLALSHGTNDAQKTMGVLTLGLLLEGRISSFEVPLWVIAASAGAIALGTSFGGWRLIRTLGGRIYRIRPVHGFASQISGAAVILGAALLGGPVSTTQVMSSAIMGVGAAERVNKVRWGILKDMLIAWLLTIPLTAAVAGLAYWLIISFIV